MFSFADAEDLNLICVSTDARKTFVKVLCPLCRFGRLAW